MRNSNLVGLVMCGGESLRMGKDKGLLKNNNKTWAENAYSKLSIISTDIYLSINKRQIESYTTIFQKNKLITDHYAIPGPLAGLISASIQTKKDLLIVACDLVDLRESSILQLNQAYIDQEVTYDYIVFKNRDSIEPLAGIYTYSGLQKVMQLHQQGKLAKVSLKYILEQGNTLYIKLTENQINEFKNYNSPTML